jgi:hypothetical protein
MRARVSALATAAATAFAGCGTGAGEEAVARYADAGPDAVARVGTVVVLDGRGSKAPEAGALAFTWSQTGGVPVFVSDFTASQPTFVPPAAGTYVFELVVLSGGGTSPPDEVVVVVVDDRAATPRRPPAAEPRAAGLRLASFLDAEPALSPLPVASFPDGSVVVAGFVDLAADPIDDPDPATIAGMLVVDVVVSGEPFARVYMTNASGDVAPRRLAFSDGTGADVVAFAVVGEPFLLDGSRSQDDEVVRTYTWTQVGGPFRFSTEDGLIDVVPVTPGTYVFELVVTDDAGLTSFPRRLHVPVLPVGAPGAGPPLAAVAALSGTEFRPVGGGNLVARVGEAVSLDGTGSRGRGSASGGDLRFLWEQVSGPRVALEGTRTAHPVFVPVLLGAYAFDLTVTDDDGVSDSARVEISVGSDDGAAVAVLAPVADQVLPGPGAPPLVVTLDGAGSEGSGPLEFKWTQVRGPALVCDRSPVPSVATVAVDRAGTYEFELRVFDGRAHSTPARRTFRVAAGGAPGP